MIFTEIKRVTGWALQQVGACIWPPLCPGCEALLAPQQSGRLCPLCYAKLKFWQDKQQVPVPQLPKDVDYFTAPLLYTGVVRQMILAFKFHNAFEVRKLFAGFLAVEAVALPLPQHLPVCVVPVPSHRKRLFARGFNQAAFLAQDVARALNLQFEPLLLRKVKHTGSQTNKSATLRKRQLQGAFKVEGQALAGKCVILVDDIWTTGSTAQACAYALKKTGAEKVYVLTLAYVAPSELEKEGFYG